MKKLEGVSEIFSEVGPTAGLKKILENMVILGDAEAAAGHLELSVEKGTEK